MSRPVKDSWFFGYWELQGNINQPPSRQDLQEKQDQIVFVD